MIPLMQLGGGQTYVNPHYIVRCWRDPDRTVIVMSDGFETAVLDTPEEIVAKIDALQQFWRDPA